jgi:flagellin-like protein
MKKRGDKRAISPVITTLIIILLALVAIGIVWIVIKNIVSEGTEGISLGRK